MSLLTSIKHYIVGFSYFIQMIISYFPSRFIRTWLLKFIYGLKIKKTSVLYNGFEIRHARSVVIGENTVIGNKAILDGRYGLFIGNNVNIGTGVVIWTAQHDYNDPFFIGKGSQVIIEDFAWVASQATILPGVKIGRGAVIAAKSLVTKDVKDYEVVGGVPAKLISTRIKDLKYNPAKNNLPFI